MQFYDVIENRTSIKRYNNNPIMNEKISRIINAAMMSPSWKNKTSYKFILVNDMHEKERLASSIMNDTSEAANSIKEAPMVAIVVADPSESGVIDDRQYYLVDSAIAMEHFVLAATNEGYGTCWIAAFDEATVRNTLNIPNDYRVVAMTPIGEKAETTSHNPKKDIREHVYLNTWDKPFTDNGPNAYH